MLSHSNQSVTIGIAILTAPLYPQVEEGFVFTSYLLKTKLVCYRTSEILSKHLKKNTIKVAARLVHYAP